MIRGPYKGRKGLYEKAVTLRKQGFGYRSIAHKLGDKIHWGTIRGWIRDIAVDKEAAQHLAAEYYIRPYKPFNELKKKESKRRFLIRERGHRCENCNLTEWLGGEIPLELHCKDGNKKNTTKKNLLLICPNCHVFTDSYKGRNSKTAKPEERTWARKLRRKGLSLREIEKEVDASTASIGRWVRDIPLTREQKIQLENRKRHHGGMVYAGSLNLPVERHTGSNPVGATKTRDK